MLFELFTSLNSSKVFGAFLMFVMNIGSKYIGKDIPLGVDIIFDNFWARMFVVLCIAFISTRDIVTSIMILLLYILVFSYILNDKSKSCVLRKTIDRSTKGMTRNEKEEFYGENKVYQFNSNYDIKEKNILLIDDVVTAGFTAQQCIKELLENGENSVYFYATATTKT